MFVASVLLYERVADNTLFASLASTLNVYRSE